MDFITLIALSTAIAAPSFQNQPRSSSGHVRRPPHMLGAGLGLLQGNIILVRGNHVRDNRIFDRLGIGAVFGFLTPELIELRRS